MASSAGTSVGLSVSSLSLSSNSAASLPLSSTGGAGSSIAATSSVALSALSSGISSSATFIRSPAPPAAPESASSSAVVTQLSVVASASSAVSSDIPSSALSSTSGSPTSFSVSSSPFSSIQTGFTASRSAALPVASAPSSSDTLPDQIPASSAASSRTSVALHSAARTSETTVATDVKSSIVSEKMAGQDASTGATASTATTQASQSSVSASTSAPSSTPSKTAAPGQDPAPPSSASTQTDAAPSSVSSPAKSSESAAPSTSQSEPAAASSPTSSAPNTPSGPARPVGPDSASDNGSTSVPAATSSGKVQGVSSSSSSLITSHAQTVSLPVIPIPLPVSTSVPNAPSVPTAPATTQSAHTVIVRPPATEVVSVDSQSFLTPLPQTHAASQAPAAPDVTSPVPQSTSVIPDPPSAPSPPSDALSDNGSKSASAMQQANAKTPTTTSTVTDQPETTLSSPVFVTTTDAKKHTIVSEPPVFTSVGVSTLSDGQLVSVTHVIANPTGIWGVSEDSGKSGFFADTKAVAGVFLAIGIIVTAIGLGICVFMRRRRRRTPRFMNSISRPLPMPDNPFEDPRSLSPQPQMRYASGYTDRTLVIAGKDGAAPSRSPFDDEMEQGSFVQGSVSHHTGSNEHLNGLGLAGIGANGRRFSAGTRRSSMESRARNPSGGSSVGVAVTSDHRIDPARPHKPEPSSARSSPSLYPPTLPALAGEDNRSLVDIPLSANNSTTLVSALPSLTGYSTSTNTAARVSSPTTRKPVPAHADFPLPEPIAPMPRTPQQQSAQQTKPPVIPPRSPLRRNSAVTARSLSRSPPPPPLASIQTQLQKPEAAVAATSYEPLTPPASFASVSPSGSHSGHEPPSPGSSSAASASTGASANPNPFADPQEQQLVDISIPPGHEMVRTGRKETFYTRFHGKQQRRPSVEWRN